MTDAELTETALKMDALGVWDAVRARNWAVKPSGTAFPYFCTAAKEDCEPRLRVRFIMLEGWQTFHDFVRHAVDETFGFASSLEEFPHFEMRLTDAGAAEFVRCDPGFFPRPLDARERVLAGKILWESYGVMMRIESSPDLTLMYADDGAMFERAESPKGVWSDKPLEIFNAPPHVERISLSKDAIAKAKDVPFDNSEALELDLRMTGKRPGAEEPARRVYRLVAVDAKTGRKAFVSEATLARDGGLRSLWEALAANVLACLIRRGRVPGSIRVPSGRTFRMLRPLCMELPFKLSMHDSLPLLDAAFAK